MNQQIKDAIEGAYRQFGKTSVGTIGEDAYYWRGLTAGVELALSLMPGWVDVKERLPQDDKPVWAIVHGLRRVMCYCEIKRGGAAFNAWCSCYDDVSGGTAEYDYDYKPTHWQAFPELPQHPAPAQNHPKTAG